MQEHPIQDDFHVVHSLNTPQGSCQYVSLQACETRKLAPVSQFPFAVRILFEGVVRNLNGKEVTVDHIRAFADYDPKKPADIEFPFMPSRVLLQDFTGVPCLVDLAAMRSAMKRLGGDATRINPRLPVNLVIDHSLNTDFAGSTDAMRKNAELEFNRNHERYEFLKWGQQAFRNFSVVPPASGICHQVNLEYLAPVVQEASDGHGGKIAYFDSVVGTDSHTTMINGLGVLGWGVGGIEAEAAMLGQPIYMNIPPVVGVRVCGQLPAGVTSTDAVLRLTEILRGHGVVNKIVEFFGAGIAGLAVPDRATLANMAPEYGATAGLFPVDALTIEYLRQTGRPQSVIDRTEAYFKAQGLFWDATTPAPEYESVVEFDLSAIKPSVSGPKRPQDRLDLDQVPAAWKAGLAAPVDKKTGYKLDAAALDKTVTFTDEQGRRVTMRHGDVVISSITSCTNTSSPALLLAAGIIARKAVEKGLAVKPHVKTSFAPGSVVVTDYLAKAGLMPWLEKLGFNTIGYGCATCIGNSGPLSDSVSKAIEENGLVVAAVLSGNRNFEGRVNPLTRANWLASPPLCVAYALAGNLDVNLASEPLGKDPNGQPVFLKDLWPSDSELKQVVEQAFQRDIFIKSYAGIEKGNAAWNQLAAPSGEVFAWNESSTYIQEPPFFKNLSKEKGTPIAPVTGARCLAWFGDSITTDHISPAGSISGGSPAGQFLVANGVAKTDFNSYGSRRGNDRIMTRGTFANIRLRNNLVAGTEGGFSRKVPGTEVKSIYEVAMAWKAENVPMVILAGKDYGMGSSRDWAAKGVQLLGVRVVIAESYERIHRSNLVGMGVLPLQFLVGETAASLGLSGEEAITIHVDDTLSPKQKVRVSAVSPGGKTTDFEAVARIDSSVEVDYYRNGGILQTVLKNFL
jgi:aconitate hydratase